MTVQRWDLEYRHGRHYTQQDVKDALVFAIEDLRNRSYYAPLMDRFPIRYDEQIPKATMRDIESYQTCACADENNVYLSTAKFAEIMNEFIDEFESGGAGMTRRECGLDLIANITALIAHEYMHILCQHMQISKRMKLHTELERDTLLVAADIEVNRGHMIEEWTAVYQHGATDTRFPETKPCKFLPEIYATLLKNAKNNMEKIQEMAEQIKDMKMSMNSGKSGKSTSSSSTKGKENANVQNQGQVPEPNANDNGKDNEKNSTTGTGLENKKEDGNKAESQMMTLTEEQIKKSIEEANKVCNSVVKERSQDDGNEYAFGLEAAATEYDPTLTPQQNLEKAYKRWEKVNVKKELKKLKGLIRGEISKNKEKTYARPSRRATPGSGLIKKGVKNEKSYSPKILIALDSSGSMNGTTMKQVACAIENIFKDLGKPKVGSYICMHESYVSDVTPMRNWKKVVEAYRPSGGNCFERVVEKANELKVDVVLNVGDGQDCCRRHDDENNPCDEFTNAKRQWFDILVSPKSENSCYERERSYDKTRGFDREAIYLGDKILEALK